MVANRKTKDKPQHAPQSHEVRPKPPRSLVLYGLLPVLALALFAAILSFLRVNSVLAGSDSAHQAGVITPLSGGDVADSTCPESVPVSDPVARAWRSLYLLIDRSSSYREYTQWALDLVQSIVPKVISPGDFLAGAWIGTDAADQDGTFCCDHRVPDIDLPTFMPLPPYPLAAPTLPAKPGASSVEQLLIDAYNGRVKAQNSSQLNDYYCTVGNRNRDAAEKMSHFAAARIDLVRAFWREMAPKFVASRFDGQTQIKEALYRAALTLNDDPERKVRSLVIFSDLVETGAPAFDGVHPDFSTIAVIIVLECREAAKCERLKTDWTGKFASMGAMQPIFVLDAHPEEKLVNLLQQR
jgi:hypothetical protein